MNLVPSVEKSSARSRAIISCGNYRGINAREYPRTLSLTSQISRPCKITEIIKAIGQSDFAVHLYAMTYERRVSRCVEWPPNATAGISRHRNPRWNTSAISMASKYFTAHPRDLSSRKTKRDRLTRATPIARDRERENGPLCRLISPHTFPAPPRTRLMIKKRITTKARCNMRGFVYDIFNIEIFSL